MDGRVDEFRQFVQSTLVTERLYDHLQVEYDDLSLWYNNGSDRLERKLSLFRHLTEHCGLLVPEPFFFTREYSVRDEATLHTLWARHDSSRQRSLYLHIPFCSPSRCHYCMYYSNVLRERSQIADYLDYLLGSVETYRPLFRDRTFQVLYVGGGTPSLLTAPQIERLLGSVLSEFSFSQDGERTYEVSPAVEFDQLKALRLLGMNRISMGVQSLIPEILAREGRPYVSLERIGEIWNWVRRLGFAEFNVDLMSGLKGDNGAAVVWTFSQLARLAIPSITVYTKRCVGPVPAVADARAHSQLTAQSHAWLHQICDAFGYRSLAKHPLAESQHFVHRTHHSCFVRYRTRYDPTTHNSCLGLGVGANSFIVDAVYFQRMPSQDGSGTVCIVGESDGKDRMRAYVVNRLYELGAVDESEFHTVYGQSLDATFQQEIDDLVGLGYLTSKGGHLSFATQDGIDRGVALKFFYKPSFLFRLYASQLAAPPAGRPAAES